MLPLSGVRPWWSRHTRGRTVPGLRRDEHGMVPGRMANPHLRCIVRGEFRSPRPMGAGSLSVGRMGHWGPGGARQRRHGGGPAGGGSGSRFAISDPTDRTRVRPAGPHSWLDSGCSSRVVAHPLRLRPTPGCRGFASLRGPTLPSTKHHLESKGMQFSDEWLVPTVTPLVTEEDVAGIRALQTDQPMSLWETMVQRKLLSNEEILSAVALRFHLSVADLSQLDPAVREEVPESLVRKFNILPVRISEHTLEVATANPFDMDAEKMLAFATGREVRTLICAPAVIRDKLDQLYAKENVVSKLLAGMSSGPDVTEIIEDEEEETSAEDAAQRPIIRLVDTMLADGVSSRASDIHVEPMEGGVVVRYRIDGVLRQVMKIPRAAGIPLISRIKIMGGMDIADRLRPQDGRARVAVNGNPVDLRISSLPASLGEKVVIRILDTQATVLDLTALGFDAEDREVFDGMLQSKEGVVLVTGPTGSGKTTTLYAALRTVQNEGLNIVTVEDPVEYRLGQGIVQVQVNPKAGLTFASALRSILRQDPDVVLIGEIRDGETAQIAVQAALTGHLVLSTLHTNDAPSTVTRLLDMGMEAYKIAASVKGVVAQRLLRRLCPVCKEVSDLDLPRHLAPLVPSGTTLYKAVGCQECAQTGYRGRFAIVEMLVMTPE
ncbi:MAG: type II/IV secretion system protein, partial [Gemmatimonadales bacterium]